MALSGQQPKPPKPEEKKEPKRTLSDRIIRTFTLGTPPKAVEKKALVLRERTPSEKASSINGYGATSVGDHKSPSPYDYKQPLLTPARSARPFQRLNTKPKIAVLAETKDDIVNYKIEQLLNELHDQSTPWTGLKSWISGFVALYAATSTASATDFTANRLVNGNLIKNALSEETREKLHLATTPAAAAPTFCLSFNSNLANWNRILRALPYMTREDFKRNALPIILTSLSGVVAMKVGLDAWKGTNPWLRWTLAAGRGLSAISVNGLFATQQWKNLRGHRDIPAVNVIKFAQQELAGYALHYPDEFISILSNSRLFERLFKVNPDETKNTKESVNNIFESILSVLGKEKLERIPPKTTDKAKTGFAYTLAAIAALPYFKTGQQIIPELFGLKSSIAFWTLGSAFGISSAAVNAAICAINTAEAMDRLANKECSWSECTFLTFKLYFLLGNSLANFGMGLQYPSPVESEYLGWIEGSVNFLVYLAIGDMSFNNFFGKLSNGYHVHWKKILDNAKAATEVGNVELKDHYETLSEEDKPVLVKILNEYLKWSFESLTDFFDHTNDDIIKLILSKEIMDRIEKVAPSPRVSVDQPPETPRLIIKIDSASDIASETKTPLGRRSHTFDPSKTPRQNRSFFGLAKRNISKGLDKLFSADALHAPAEFADSTIVHRTLSKRRES